MGEIPESGFRVTLTYFSAKCSVHDFVYFEWNDKSNMRKNNSQWNLVNTDNFNTTKNVKFLNKLKSIILDSELSEITNITLSQIR